MEFHYGIDYDRIISEKGETGDYWQKPRETLLKFKSGGAILDLGCSSGSFLESLKNSSWELFGVEISPTMAKRAEVRTGAKVFEGDILDAPFPPESFDAITCFHNLEHVYHPRQVLEKVSGWLKPGGVFYLLIPNIDSGASRIFGSYWYALEIPRHLYHFSPISLRNLTSQVGLQELMLKTDREPFIEYSIRYIFDAVLKNVGFHRVPLALAKSPCLPWKCVRKMFRLTLLPMISSVISLAGDGEIINAIFRKNIPANEQDCKYSGIPSREN
jgi:SAM-dependent methyltransferase